MIRRFLIAAICSAALAGGLLSRTSQAQGQVQGQAYGRAWGTAYNSQNWQRYYHYPYIYYPQNFWGHDYYRSSNSMYHRYPAEMRTPVYNKSWHNYYPQGRRYHYGHHFMLDVF